MSKVLFKLLLKLLIEQLVRVELHQSAEKLGQFVAVLEVLIKVLQRLQHLYKVTHDVGEDRNSEKEYERACYAL